METPTVEEIADEIICRASRTDAALTDVIRDVCAQLGYFDVSLTYQPERVPRR